jgi:antitoxin CptB
MDRLSLDRLKWKCRRGLLELDLVFQRMEFKNLNEQEAFAMSELLDLPDNDLWDIVAGRSDAFHPKFEAVVARLRAC